MGPHTRLLSDPTLIQDELDRRLEQLRVTNPATAQRARLEQDLTRTTTGIARLVQAYQEQLLTLAELRARMPELRKRETTIRAQLDALDAQLLDQETHLKLAEDLGSFLGRLRETAGSASIQDRQRVLRAVVREVLIGPGGITIRHTIPTPSRDPTPGCLLRGRSQSTLSAIVTSPRCTARSPTPTRWSEGSLSIRSSCAATR